MFIVVINEYTDLCNYGHSYHLITNLVPWPHLWNEYFLPRCCCLFSTGMKTGMNGIERHRMTSRKGPQTVKTGELKSLHTNAWQINRLLFHLMLKRLTPMFSAAQSPHWRRWARGGSHLISWCAVQLGGTLSGNFSAPSSARRTCCSGSHVRSSAKRPIKVWLRRRPGSFTRTTSPFSRRKRCGTFIDLYFGKIEFPCWAKPCDVWAQWVYQCHFHVLVGEASYT